MNKKVKWGMIGLGDIAHQFAEAFESDKAELYAAGSRSIKKATDFAQKYNIKKAYGSYEDLYADEAIDVVYLATPNSYHAENMIDILNAGKHVLTEKTITMNKKELDQVLDLAKEKNLIVAEAMTIYHLPIYQEIKKRIDANEFGEMKMANAYFGSLKEADPKNRFFNPDLGGGALLDIGVYALSFVQYFLNSSPRNLKTLIEFYETGVDEMSTISYQTESGKLANISLSFRGKLPKQGVIVCEDAYITFLDYPRADQATITYPDGQSEIVKAGDADKALNYEMENISEMILSGENLSELEKTIQVNQLISQLAKEWEMDWLFD